MLLIIIMVISQKVRHKIAPNTYVINVQMNYMTSPADRRNCACNHKIIRNSNQQSGAAEACWAHNPEVDGSKPSSATYAVIV